MTTIPKRILIVGLETIGAKILAMPLGQVRGEAGSNFGLLERGQRGTPARCAHR